MTGQDTGRTATRHFSPLHCYLEHDMNWTEVLAFSLGYLVTPALAVGAAAFVIHVILKFQKYSAERALRADSLITTAS